MVSAGAARVDQFVSGGAAVGAGGVCETMAGGGGLNR